MGVIIRAGSLGSCYLATRSSGGVNQVEWIPAYWSPDFPGARDKVIDPTGAGNAYCGALAAALADHLDLGEGELHIHYFGVRG